MDITRLPSAPYGRPVTALVNSSSRVGNVSAFEPVAEAEDRYLFDNERPARLVQGELLDRQRDFYQSTSAFVNERYLDQTRPADQPGTSALKSNAAILQYANNIRPESIADLTQGRSVNFFV
ncbi:hypothetical protein MNBD_GAMMA15-176 [hydrothermal vent metagenome]|uniref:Uncharacterized protein n=1 Tax=hydrothermal vent metagenome TaxID=652676 RepID=A0A3B0YB57_9ZZZZ